jgi:hypothetical protein
MPIELWTKIQGMNSWIIPIQDEEVTLLQKDVVLGDNLLIQRGYRNSKPFSRGIDYGPSLKQNHPVFLRDVIRMYRNVVTWYLSSEKTHFDIQ